MAGHGLEFLASENPWSPSEAVAEINARIGAGLELVGLAEQQGGTSSAAYVRWPDGRESVLTRTHISLARMRQTGEVLSSLASEGLPVPRHELVLDLADGRLGVVQQRLAGHPLKQVDRAAMDAVIATNARFAGVLRGRWNLPRPTCLLQPGDAAEEQLHGILRAHSERVRRLSERIRQIGRDFPVGVVGGGLVHPDFGLGNVLFDQDGQVTGVVDWNWGAGRGDHMFALLKMVMNVNNEGEQYGVTPEARARLHDVVGGTIEPDLLRFYWAGWLLHDTRFAIETGNARRLNQALSLAETHLD